MEGIKIHLKEIKPKFEKNIPSDFFEGILFL